MVAAAVAFSTPLFAQTSALQQQLQASIKQQNGDVGIAIWVPGKYQPVAINGDKHYPMQSVYKFHLGLTVLHLVDQGKLKLDQKIHVKKSDLLPDTWSPLRDKYPAGEVDVPLSEIIEFTVASSDNNGCDILFRLIGGPKVANDYIHKLGVQDCAIKSTEAEMHKDDQLQFQNWTTPNAANQLLQHFMNGKILKPKTTAYLTKVLEGTVTGGGKIKGLLPKGTIVAHKTGNSGINAVGIIAASNDIGFVHLPDGKTMLISVFVSMAKADDKTVDATIAKLSKIAWDFNAK